MNSYRIARQVAGVTQERWAEMLDCSVESVRNWEARNWLPSDAIAQAMAELSGYSILALNHIREKSKLARETIPEVAHSSLSEAVINLLLAMKAAMPQIDELLVIAKDNRVDDCESDAFAQIVDDLDEVISAAMQVKYAEKGGE